MSSFRWRQFDFFDQERLPEPLRDGANGGASASVDPLPPTAAETIRSLAVTCTSASAASAGDGSDGGFFALGDESGDVHLVPSSLRLHSFRAHGGRVCLVQLVRGGGWLATLGLEQDGAAMRATFKLWRVSAASGPGRAPDELACTCVRMCKVFASAAAEVDVTALAVSECLTLAALGLRTGGVLLARTDGYDLTRDKPLAFRVCARPPLAGAAAVDADGAESSAAVHSLFFSSLAAVAEPRAAAAGAADARAHAPVAGARRAPSGLFIVSACAISSVSLPQQQQPAASAAEPLPVCHLDSSAGCAPGCAALSPAGALAVGRSEAVFLFGLEERGRCFAFDRRKRALAFVGRYLLLLTDGGERGDEIDATAAASARGAADALAGAVRAAPLGGSQLSIFDLEHRLIAHAAPAPARVRALGGAWGGGALLSEDGSAWRLRERPMQAKLQSLAARGQYEVALALALAHGCAGAELAQLRARYGGYLFSLGEADAAVAQLTLTIGELPSAVVIRQLLDGARIEQLATYLEALHAPDAPAGCLRAEHTSLLLSSYLQLGRLERAAELTATDGFRTERAHAVVAQPQQPARGLAAAGAADAPSPAARGRDGGRDGGLGGGSGGGPGGSAGFDLESAIRLCREGGLVDEALELTQRHGRHHDYLAILLEDAKPPRAARALTYIAALGRDDARSALLAFAKALVDALPDRTTGVIMHHLTAHLPNHATAAGPVHGGAVDAGEAERKGADADAELAELVRLYGRQQHWLMVLLEYLASLPHPTLAEAEADGGRAASGGSFGARLWETLFDLYLKPATHAAPTGDAGEAGRGPSLALRAERQAEERARGEEKALALLSGFRPSDSLVVLCAQHDFDRGMRSVLEQGRSHALILQRLLDRGEHADALQACRRYADAEPALWVCALQHWAALCAAEPEAGKPARASSGAEAPSLLACVEEAVNAVERLGLLPPVLIVQELARNAAMPLAPVRALLLRHLAAVRAARADDERQARSYGLETSAMRRELLELRKSATVFQLSRCCRSGAPLELPTVHFLCGHSFNLSALGDAADACPLCAPDHTRVLGQQRTLGARAGQHDVFFKQVEGSVDGFVTVAEYFGRGVMSGSAKTA